MKKILSLGLFMSLAACNKLNMMFDMPDKMDKMTDKMNQMSDGLDQTNKNMNNMKDLMGQTVDGVNKQKVILPFEQLMNEDNYDMLSPIPSKLMPWAKEFAAAIPAYDFAELTFLWLKEIREVNPIKKTDKDGNEIEYTADEVARINKVKLGRLAALQAVCGFLPEDKLNEIIDLHIKKYSQFEETAYNILMLRSQFVRDVLLKESLLSQPLTTVGKIKKSVYYVGQLDFISRLSYTNKIAVTVSGFLPPMDPSTTEKFDVKINYALMKKIKLSVDQDFKSDQQMMAFGNSEEDTAIHNAKMADFEKSMADLNSRLQYWESTGLK